MVTSAGEGGLTHLNKPLAFGRLLQAFERLHADIRWMCGAVQLNESARYTCDHIDMPVVAIFFAGDELKLTRFTVHGRTSGKAMRVVRVIGRRRSAIAFP
ncbi:hypothetical protein D3C84_765480 [compost metagenome]